MANRADLRILIFGNSVRTDEYSLARHRAIFDAFAGPKQEFGAAYA